MSLSEREILEFIQESPTPVTKREIAKAFHIKGGENRVALKQILKKLEKEGIAAKHPGGGYSIPEGLPSVAVIEVSDIDVDGDVFARPVDWKIERQGEPPRIEVMPDKKGHPALKQGDRILARLQRSGEVYEAYTIKRLDTEIGRVMGLLRLTKNGYILQPANKRAKYDFEVPTGEEGDAKDGDLVVGEIQPSRGLRNKRARIVEIIGERDDPKAISLISMHEVGLRNVFPEEVLKSTEKMSVHELAKREDLRDVPLVTIDGEDARDFDDAVFAESCILPNGDKGFHLIVAIADVSFYVRPGSSLDVEAQKRGNSTYFPDRVVPMLPEALSNDLCSLRPDEDRAAMAAHLWIDEAGMLVKYKFTRALIRSHARLIYEDVQKQHDDGKDSPLCRILNPLYEVYDVLLAARKQRGALDLDLPEKKIVIDENNEMSGVEQRIRLDSHCLIEEFMVLANVAAAKALEDKRSICVYRIHDKPSLDKLDSVREFIETFGLTMPKGQSIKSKQINGLLEKAKDLPYTHLISQVILRSQSQAVYSPQNIGHFGLALTHYAHFTSPIRRYADLLVHRSLVSAYGLGPGGLSEEEEVRIEEISGHISSTERVSMEAERNSVDRFTAAYLSDQIGAEFTGTISGVTRFGLFVTLSESGADGLIPMKSLDDDYYVHDEDAHALIGRRKKKVFRLGAKVSVLLKEADGMTGSTVLELTQACKDKGADIPGFVQPKGKKPFEQKRFPPSRGKSKKFSGKRKRSHKK